MLLSASTLPLLTALPLLKSTLPADGWQGSAGVPAAVQEGDQTQVVHVPFQWV